MTPPIRPPEPDLAVVWQHHLPAGVKPLEYEAAAGRLMPEVYAQLMHCGDPLTLARNDVVVTVSLRPLETS